MQVTISRHIEVKRAEVTIALTCAAAVYFGVHVFVLHHEMMAHGFDLTAVPVVDRLIAFLSGHSE